MAGQTPDQPKQQTEETVKRSKIVLGAASALCILALLAAPAAAAFQRGADGGGPGPEALLEKLEAQGYDLSEIRSAIESGDTETARELLRKFMEEHRDELPTPPADGNRQMHISGLLDRLEEQGYDVSAIRAAIESGDTETARTLLQQFMEEHRDELPAPPETGDRGFGPLARLNYLEQQGYDVSAIRDAIDNGDHETARALMQQFMEEHRDELPTPPGTGTHGHRCNTSTE